MRGTPGDRINFRRGFFPTVACLVAVLLSACFDRETEIQRGDREQILHRGVGAEPADLDPHLASLANDYAILSALFEGLVSEDPADLHPVPGVAARWDVSLDGLHYTFHLRPEAKWSNGEPLTATDFVASWQRMLSPTLAAGNAPLLFLIQGAEAYNKKKSTDFREVGVRATDAHTLEVTLEHPTPYFLAQLNQPAWFPVPVGTIRKFGDPNSRGTPWTRPGKFVGNGPFILRSWNHGQEIIVEKSPQYWDAAKVRLAGIHFHTIESLDGEERAFRAGQLHITEAIPPSKIDTYQRTLPDLLRIDPLLGTYFYRVNVVRPYLSDVRVRQALSLAIDRPAIVEKILRGGQLPAATLVPPSLAHYTVSDPQHTDFAHARELLVQAGYPNGRGLPEFELLYNTSEAHKAIAEAIQEMWRRELGVQVRLQNQETTSVLAARREGNFQIMRSVWISDFADPASFLDVWRTDSANNFTGWSSPAYDSILFNASRTTDPAARGEFFAKAESLLLADLPILPIYHYTHVFLIQRSVHGWNPTLLDHHPYKNVWLGN